MVSDLGGCWDGLLNCSIEEWGSGCTGVYLLFGELGVELDGGVAMGSTVMNVEKILELGPYSPRRHGLLR